MNGDFSLRVDPPAVVDAAGTARAAAQVALDLGEGLTSLAQGPPAFLAGAGSAFARLSAAWFAELQRIATSASDLGDHAEQAAADYVVVDRTAGGSLGGG